MTERTIAVNRRARFQYAIDDVIEAGIALTGTEIKSIRAGHVSLAEAYARIERGEAWLIGAHIAPYAQGNQFNHEPTRTRKLLLHKREIERLMGKVREKGLTIVPTRMYFSGSNAKVEIALAKGKKTWDKRQSLAARQADREKEQALGRRLKGMD